MMAHRILIAFMPSITNAVCTTRYIQMWSLLNGVLFILVPSFLQWNMKKELFFNLCGTVSNFAA
jgi:hypothetical protein